MRRRSIAALVAALPVAALVAGEAYAASPAAATGPATAVGSTTATVAGSVTPGGRSASWYVEYGTTTSYGSRTTSTSAGSGPAAVSVSTTLSGLRAGTTYHYRLVATSGDGTGRGGDAVFTTLVPPDTVTGAASGVGAATATLNGTVDANGRSTTFYFEYGTSTSYGTKTGVRSAGSATSVQPVSVTVSGLEPGRTYHFRIVASSDAGTSTGRDASFTTSGAPTVDTADARPVGTTSATLRGNVTANGLSTSWWFEYGRTASYGSRTGSHSAGSGRSERGVSAGITRLKPSTTYHFRLVAQNGRGRSYGGERTFTTAGPPSVQTGVAQGVGPDTAQLVGSLDTGGRSTTWWFEYGTSTRYGSSTARRNAVTAAGMQGVGAAVTGLAPATAYHYRLVARSDGGTSYGRDVSFTTEGVTLTVRARQVVFGGRIVLSGVVPTHAAGEQVVVFAQVFGRGSASSVATILTGPGGTWSYVARPQVATSYQASWRGGLSPAVSIGVHPRVALTRLRNGHFLVHVTGGRSFAHRVVQLQRRVGARWVTVKRARLGSRSRVELRAVLPRGSSTVRIAFSVNQAGAGFLGGTSRALTVTRR